MPRSQNKVASHRRRKRILARAKGYWGARSKVLTIAKHHLDKAGQHAYHDRRLKKRSFRQLWIARINAAARVNGTTYSRLIHAMKTARILVNRKMLADLAVREPKVFEAIVQKAQAA